MNKRNLARLLWTLLSVALSLATSQTSLAQATSYPDRPVIQAQTFAVTSYGAVGNGSTNNTSAIQAAINACSTAGGGTVAIPSGVFMCGPLTLKSGVNLNIGSGATLRMLPYGTYPTNSGGTYDAFLLGTSVTDAQVSGSGTIDGQGQAWWTAYDASNFKRPGFVAFSKCTRVAIVGVKLLNPPNGHVSISQGTSHISIIGVTFSAPSDSPNTDGIDIWGPNCLVSGCTIACGDDNIALDSGGTTGAGNLTVTHCTFGVGHGMSIGSYTGGVGIGEITVEECTFDGATPIRMKTSRDRGSLVENLLYKNLSGKNFGRAIFISSYYPDSSIPASATADPAQAVTATTPFWNNIKVSHFTATGVTTEAGLVVGLPEALLTNMVLNDVNITAPKGMRLWHAANVTLKGTTITAASGSAVITGDASYTTTTVEKDVNLTTSPGLQTIAKGSSASYTATVSAYGGFTGTVTLAVSGLPTGATATFSPASVTTSGTSTLKITTSSTTPVGIHPLKVTATSGSYSAYSTIVLVVNPVIALNCGGTANGVFGADASFSGGTAYSTSATIDTSAVTNPAPASVYQTERYGNFTYTIGSLVAGASYKVRLHLAESYWSAAGKRTFNAAINGTSVLSAFDIYAAAGAKSKAIVKEFTATANSSGQIAIQFTSIVDNAKVNGIEIIKL